MKRSKGETAASYVLREQDSYARMLEALNKLRDRPGKREERRERQRRHRVELRRYRRGWSEWEDAESATFKSDAKADSISSGSESDEGFFGDEIRGYQLLRNARISPSEKQTILAHTQNSTSFATIRAALITW